ncbi:hypothetical protein Vretimale_19930 [Volvox reticuliferus]|uniref:DUF938 domain-containing protein n=1 Tax=Volvox reticuliferus TaxID=1737510 RepID=A0A8J4M0F2_9CHLO|nr:hypothetical protein Vretifemale_20923 [Volvox reticuliferus]GIM17378.1 hypothetical protein Vretimale_19930 [Volvox reticuliferus]
MLHKYSQRCGILHRTRLTGTAVIMAMSPSLASATSSTANGSGNFQFKGSTDRYACLEGQKRESPAAERNKQPILDVLLEYLPNAGDATSKGNAATSAAAAAADGTSSGPRRRPLILEIASGSGQHTAHLAAALHEYDIQPSDVTSELFGSIAAYAAGCSNVMLPPLLLDAAAADEWPRAAAAAAAKPPTAAVPAAAAEELLSTGRSAAASGATDAAAFADAILCVNMCHISPLGATRGLMRGAGAALRRGSGLLFVYGPFTVDGRHTTDSNAAFDTSLRSRNPEWGYRDVKDMAAWAGDAGMEPLEVRSMPANNFMLVFRRRP